MVRDIAALIALLEGRASRPFEWGHDKHDCVSFAAAAVEAQTGENPIRRLGYTWSTERGAARLLNRLGGVAAVADLALTRLPAPAFAHRGDIGLVEIEGRQSLVVIEGELVAGPGLAGLVRGPRSALTLAWSAV